jgi:predicted RNase H-like HicB family nuclease
MKLTSVIIKGKDGYLIGQLKELPSIITQGKTMEEVKDNLKDALELYLEDIRSEKPEIEGEILAEEDFAFAH